jgi:hypothetical protein
MIGKISSESIKSKSSKLTEIIITGCPCLASLEGSLLEQKLNMGALHVPNDDDCIRPRSASIPFDEMKELLVLGSLQQLTNLSMLKLQNCSSLVSLPSADVFKSLRSLKIVNIAGCKNLSSLGGLGLLSSLLRLGIIGCSKLVEAAQSLVTRGDEEAYLVEPSKSLQITTLHIDLPSLLLVEPLKSLCRTEKLRISGVSAMDRLPDRWLLQNRPALQHLVIYKSNSLKSIPPSMQDLCSLETLCLFDVGQLQSLAYLPSSLKVLFVSGCHPGLEKKITKHGTSEWNKIAHIPDVIVGTSTLPLLSSRS